MTEQHPEASGAEGNIATAPARPLISVVIATRNRAGMLRESIHSVLCQTYPQLEVVVVDDGSEDDTHEVVTSIGDPRVRYVHQAPGGISSARNRGTAHARGEWIAVHDDDDLMLPSRLAEQMAHADDSVDFVYGAFINFDDETGELQLHHGRNYGYGPALMSGFAPGHSTWLVRTSTMQRFPYDEGIESAVDNNVVFRMLRSGVRFRHSGAICLLRRVHNGRITSTGGAKQKYVADLNLAFIGRGVPATSRTTLTKAARFDWGPVDKTSWETRHLPFLPDHLVKRSGVLTLVDDISSGEDCQVPTVRLEAVDASRSTWDELYAACGRGAETTSLHARLLESPQIEALLSDGDLTAAIDRPDLSQAALLQLLRLRAVATAVSPDTPGDQDPPFLLVAAAASKTWTTAQRELTTACCLVTNGGSETLFGLIPLHSWTAATSLTRRTFSEDFSVRTYSLAAPSRIVAELAAAS